MFAVCQDYLNYFWNLLRYKDSKTFFSRKIHLSHATNTLKREHEFLILQFFSLFLRRIHIFIVVSRNNCRSSNSRKLLMSRHKKTGSCERRAHKLTQLKFCVVQILLLAAQFQSNSLSCCLFQGQSLILSYFFEL